MKLSCLQENLTRGLATVSRAVSTKTTLPITQHILLRTEGTKLKLTATNLEMTTSCWIGAKVDQEGAVTIPAKLLSAFIDSLPNDQIDLELSGHKLDFKCLRFEAKISGMDASDFPPTPKVSGGITTKVEPKAFREAISQVLLAAAADEPRPVLTAICCEFDGDKLTMASADGFRLAVATTTLLDPVVKSTLLVPARALNEVNRLSAEQEKPIEIVSNQQNTQVLFCLQNIEIVSQLIQGAFPDYSKLIPSKYTTHATVDVSELLRAVKMSAIFARDASNIIRLVVTPGMPGKMVIEARAEELGSNKGVVDLVVDGEPTKIAFNARYLIDILGAMCTPKMTIEISNPSSPGVFRPVGGHDYIHVLMPMFVQW